MFRTYENLTCDHIGIQSLVEDWAKAIRDGDMEGILAHHTTDIIMFDVPIPLQSVGIEACKKTGICFFNIIWKERAHLN